MSTRSMHRFCLVLVLIASTVNAARVQAASPVRQSVIMSEAGPVIAQRLASLEYPWGMEQLPNGDLLLTEKPGRLRRFSDAGLSEPITGVPKVSFNGQGGLLDVAIPRDFSSSGRVCLYFVEAADTQPAGAKVTADPRLGTYVDTTDTVLKGGAVFCARLEGNALVDGRVIWRQTPKVVGLGHFGGRLLFGADGNLWIASGDRQSFAPAQDPLSNLGKIVRLTPDGSTPADNPQPGEPEPTSATWSSGHRNPLGIAVNPTSGEVFVAEMGPLHGDELNALRPRANYGWPLVGNGENYDFSDIPHHETSPGRYVQPEYYWRPAISPSSLTFYEGSLFKDWAGDALIGSLSTRALVRLDFDGAVVVREERLDIGARVRDVLVARDGSILLLTDAPDGELLRLAPEQSGASTDARWPGWEAPRGSDAAVWTGPVGDAP